jgi:hypothetical protein
MAKPKRGATAMFYIWTLDSHESIGPFKSEMIAHCYAKANGRTSYYIERELEAWQRYSMLKIVDDFDLVDGLLLKLN